MSKKQLYRWKQKGLFKTFKLADEKRSELLAEGVQHVKVRRCGPGGTQFKVTVEDPVESKDARSKKNKKTKSE